MHWAWMLPLSSRSNIAAIEGVGVVGPLILLRLALSSRLSLSLSAPCSTLASAEYEHFLSANAARVPVFQCAE